MLAAIFTFSSDQLTEVDQKHSKTSPWLFDFTLPETNIAPKNLGCLTLRFCVSASKSSFPWPNITTRNSLGMALAENFRRFHGDSQQGRQKTCCGIGEVMLSIDLYIELRVGKSANKNIKLVHKS